MFVLFHKYRQQTIINYLKSSNKKLNSAADHRFMNDFVENYCHLDGSFVFAIIRRNTNYMITYEIINLLFTKYCMSVIELNKKFDLELNDLDLIDEKKSVIEFHSQNNQENTLP